MTKCPNCGSTELYFVRQQEFSFLACKDCDHECGDFPPDPDFESAKIGDADNG